jgi:hypothetical protein
VNANSNNVVRLRASDGANRGTFAVGDGPISLVTGDFNGDGRLDLAATNYNSDEISVLLGNGDGTFQEPKRFAAGEIPTSLVTGDFNADRRLDLVANTKSGDISVLLGNGDGTSSSGSSRLPSGVRGFQWRRATTGRHQLQRSDISCCSATVTAPPDPSRSGWEPSQSLWCRGLQWGWATRPGHLRPHHSRAAGQRPALVTSSLFATAPDTTPLVADVNRGGTDDSVIDTAGSILFAGSLDGPGPLCRP